MSNYLKAKHLLEEELEDTKDKTLLKIINDMHTYWLQRERVLMPVRKSSKWNWFRRKKRRSGGKGWIRKLVN